MLKMEGVNLGPYTFSMDGVDPGSISQHGRGAGSWALLSAWKGWMQGPTISMEGVDPGPYPQHGRGGSRTLFHARNFHIISHKAKLNEIP